MQPKNNALQWMREVTVCVKYPKICAPEIVFLTLIFVGRGYLYWLPRYEIWPFQQKITYYTKFGKLNEPFSDEKAKL